MQKIKDICDQNGIIFVVANQQMRSFVVKDDKEVKGVTYEDELEIVMKKMTNVGKLKEIEIILVIHNGIMNRIESWVKESGTPFVDIIQALDQNRDELTSWVHLTPKGNEMIAAEFSKEILKQFAGNAISQ